MTEIGEDGMTDVWTGRRAGSACGHAEPRQVRPRRGISVSSRRGWGPGASGKMLAAGAASLVRSTRLGRADARKPRRKPAPQTRKPAPPPVQLTKAVPEMKCPSVLGVGVTTMREFCDILSGRTPLEGLIITLPPHRGDLTLMFDLHNRHTYSDELMKAKRGYARYTAMIGALAMDNTLIQRAAIQTEFRAAADLFDRIGGGAGPGGVKAVAPAGVEQHPPGDPRGRERDQPARREGHGRSRRRQCDLQFARTADRCRQQRDDRISPRSASQAGASGQAAAAQTTAREKVTWGICTISIVIGSSFGGVMAAWPSVMAGKNVLMIERGDWVAARAAESRRRRVLRADSRLQCRRAVPRARRRRQRHARHDRLRRRRVGLLRRRVAAPAGTRLRGRSGDRRRLRGRMAVQVRGISSRSTRRPSSCLAWPVRPGRIRRNPGGRPRTRRRRRRGRRCRIGSPAQRRSLGLHPFRAPARHQLHGQRVAGRHASRATPATASPAPFTRRTTSSAIDPGSAGAWPAARNQHGGGAPDDSRDAGSPRWSASIGVTRQPRRFAGRTVVVAGGALATPHLLLASGLEEMNPAGDAVGRYLMRHCNAIVMGWFAQEAGAARRVPQAHRHPRLLLRDRRRLARRPESSGCLQQFGTPQTDYVVGLAGGWIERHTAGWRQAAAAHGRADGAARHRPADQRVDCHRRGPAQPGESGGARVRTAEPVRDAARDDCSSIRCARYSPRATPWSAPRGGSSGRRARCR